MDPQEGSLQNLIFRLKENREQLDVKTKIQIAIDIAKEIEEVHNDQKCFGNVNPVKIMMKVGMNPEVGEGLIYIATFDQQTLNAYKSSNTNSFIAPENRNLTKGSNPTEKAQDVFGFGVTIHCLFHECSSPARELFLPAKKVQKVLNHPSEYLYYLYRFGIKMKCSCDTCACEELDKVVSECCLRNPVKRSTIQIARKKLEIILERLLGHPWRLLDRLEEFLKGISIPGIISERDNKECIGELYSALEKVEKLDPRDVGGKKMKILVRLKEAFKAFELTGCMHIPDRMRDIFELQSVTRGLVRMLERVSPFQLKGRFYVPNSELFYFVGKPKEGEEGTEGNKETVELKLVKFPREEDIHDDLRFGVKRKFHNMQKAMGEGYNYADPYCTFIGNVVFDPREFEEEKVFDLVFENGYAYFFQVKVHIEKEGYGNGMEVGLVHGDYDPCKKLSEQPTSWAFNCCTLERNVKSKCDGTRKYGRKRAYGTYMLGVEVDFSSGGQYGYVKFHVDGQSCGVAYRKVIPPVRPAFSVWHLRDTIHMYPQRKRLVKRVPLGKIIDEVFREDREKREKEEKEKREKEEKEKREREKREKEKREKEKREKREKEEKEKEEKEGKEEKEEKEKLSGNK